MVNFYALLKEADPTKEVGSTSKAKVDGGDKKPTRKTSRLSKATKPTGGTQVPDEIPSRQQTGEPSAPGLNINLQIHISADATPDQIDQIFSSMAKHIYQKW